MSAAARPSTEATAELRKHPHWVVWRPSMRDGRPTKIPYDATEPRTKASSTNSDTWAAHTHAAKAVERGQAAGVGYVFSPSDEYVGVDLDKCVVDGHVDPRAMDVVRALDSYTELSPSGTGLHVWVRGNWGDGRRTSKTPWGGELEVYDRGRYFTVTEQHFAGTPTRIEARQAELDALRAQFFAGEPETPPPRKPSAPSVDLDDDELLRRAGAAKNGSKFDTLYRGDRNGHESASQADLALCNMLAFWTGPDPARIDRLFRRSGLMRDKWDEKRKESTYGWETIDQALARRTDFYSGPTTPPRARAQDGRESAVQASREELTALLALDKIALDVTGAVLYGRDTKARGEILISDETTLTLDPIGAYSTAPKLNAEIALQVGAEPGLQPKQVPRVLSLLRTIAEYREAETSDQRAADLGISFLQEAKVRSVDMDKQADRWTAFFDLQKVNPVVTAKADDTTIAAQSVVLEDAKTGLRYVRVQWFTDYARASTAPGAAVEVVRAMRALGWDRPGGEGRIKATAPDGDTRQWAFFVVPAGWEKR